MLKTPDRGRIVFWCPPAAGTVAAVSFRGTPARSAGSSIASLQQSRPH